MSKRASWKRALSPLRAGEAIEYAKQMRIVTITRLRMIHLPISSAPSSLNDTEAEMTAITARRRFPDYDALSIPKRLELNWVYQCQSEEKRNLGWSEAGLM